MKNKIRLDQLMVEQGLAPTRSKAQALILAGLVLDANRQRLDKPGLQLAADAVIHLKGLDHPWVSRGGMKLKQAVDQFSLDPTGWIAADIGASTGGFTDVLLQHGAARVYAVDVGYGQLDHRLRIDPRVVVLEKTNARHLTAGQIPDGLDAVVCDASFISLKTLLPAALAFCRPGAVLAALIKPQFEVGKSLVGKGGVVNDPALHQAVCDDITQWINSYGWQARGITQSPITGPAGNKEFLIVADKA